MFIIFHNNSVWVSYTEQRENWETSTSIAKGLFDKNKTNIPEEIKDFISIKITTSVRELVGAINRTFFINLKI
jgi:chromosomal replication initiation ATPase DnaA